MGVRQTRCQLNIFETQLFRFSLGIFKLSFRMDLEIETSLSKTSFGKLDSGDTEK